ncbi:MAG: PilZ domain-containing protein, partial [Candidatus Omnitrophica bacterium]|nr:PilZ domain-containing protein [Candidatus Omnitrophota bacterium]
MDDQNSERREHPRFNTEININFHVKYDLETKVEYEVLDKDEHHPVSAKYDATGKNISVRGISFISNVKLQQGLLLHLDVYVPASKAPIEMEGMVVWTKSITQSDGRESYQTGVDLQSVHG